MHIYFDVGSTMINSLPLNLIKTILNLFFISFWTKSYIEKVCNISKSSIETYRKYTFCVHMHNLHPDANLHPGANKFAPPRKEEQICTQVQILKTRFTWPKICTQVQNLKTPFTCPKIHQDCKFAPRCKFAPGCKLCI